MRKIFGVFVSLFPIFAILIIWLVSDWVTFVFVFCGVILGLDILGWFVWFWALGQKIIESGEKL